MSKVSKKVDNILNNVSSDAANIAKGYGGSPKREAFPARIDSPSEKVIKGLNNSHIVLGKDRYGTINKGYGAAGVDGVGMIHLVAGHFGARLRNYEEDADNPTLADPDFTIDSSYIYISQKADVDVYLGLKPGVVGDSRTRACIAIKSDDIRIVGQNGIKLVTSPSSRDSTGKFLLEMKGIDLMAGNDDADMQPITKAKNTADALIEMKNICQSILSLVFDIIDKQASADAAIATHQHTTTVPQSPTLPLDNTLFSDAMAANYFFTGAATKKIDGLKKKLMEIDEKFLQKTGEKYIGSKLNNTN